MKQTAKKLGAWGILITVVTGLANEARVQVKNNTESIVKLKADENNTEKKLEEVHKDVREIRQILIRRR